MDFLKTKGLLLKSLFMCCKRTKSNDTRGKWVKEWLRNLNGVGWIKGKKSLSPIY